MVDETNENIEQITCDNLEMSTPDLIKKLRDIYISKGQGDAWLAEEVNWDQIISKIKYQKGGTGFNYRICDVLDIGGAGAVFKIVDCNLFTDIGNEQSSLEDKLRRSYRALKIPRPHANRASILADSLRSEVSKLATLSHQNIVSLYAKGQIDIEMQSGRTTWPWFIMDYLHEATDLNKIYEENPPNIPTLIGFLHDTAKGLKYIHDSGLIHCDVKPSNIFLSRSGDSRAETHALLADFGYAKKYREHDELTTIGFTDRYAHPNLQYGSNYTSQESRAFNKIERYKIKPVFDLFALGMSVKYLLETHYQRYSIYRKYSYELKYLKLCAARLLDGYNSVKDYTFFNLPFSCFNDYEKDEKQGYVEGIKYKSISEFIDDIKKLKGEWSPEIEIPELIETRRENIQVSDSAPVVYTERVRKLVNHPIIRRLSSVTQLGLTSLVYPGVMHSRLEHSLGTFGVTAKYINSLISDTSNPLFRQLVTPIQIKRTLLAALLHDVGQYPLAHDLEDVSHKFFGHENIGNKLLWSSAVSGPANQDLLQHDFESEISNLSRDFVRILYEFWGVTLKDVSLILRAKSSDRRGDSQSGSHVNRLCKSLLDGPIDADKLDYLERDSRHCNVKYGFGIDRHRLFKCLTVACDSVSENQLLLVAGVHEKGRIAAESIWFARYAMLTQVYWHHTMRSLKALLHLAAAEILNNSDETKLDYLGNEFIKCAIFEKEIGDADWIEKKKQSKAIGSIHPGDLRVLSWLWHHSNFLGKKAVENIINRNIFKRILTVYRAELSREIGNKLDKIFKPEAFKNRLLLRENIEKAIMSKLQESRYPKSLIETQGFSMDEWRQRLEEPLLRCLIDFPAKRAGADFGLKVVKQWGERPPREDDEGPAEQPIDRQSRIIPLQHFDDGLKELENSIRCLRIFWDPQEYQIIIDTLKDDQIKRVVENEIKSFRL